MLSRKGLDTIKAGMQYILEADEGLVAISEDFQDFEQRAIAQEVNSFAMQ
jgi:hypothetical protein